MLLRKLAAALGPLLLCLVVCAAFRWVDGLLGAANFFAFLLKGLLLGLCLALVLPLAGVSARTNGLVPWLFAGAGLLLILLAYQYLETSGVLHSALLLNLISIHGQVVLVESTVMGYLCATALMYRRR